MENDMTIEEELAQSYASYPEFGAIAERPALETEVRALLEIAEIDTAYTPRVLLEIRLALALYSPLSFMVDEFASLEGVTREKAETLYSLIKTCILSPVIEDLKYYDEKWVAFLAVDDTNSSDASTVEQVHEAKEPLELKPESANEPPKTFTREELLRALASKRTMASDIESIQNRESGK